MSLFLDVFSATRPLVLRTSHTILGHTPAAVGQAAVDHNQDNALLLESAGRTLASAVVAVGGHQPHSTTPASHLHSLRSASVQHPQGIQNSSGSPARTHSGRSHSRTPSQGELLLHPVGVGVGPDLCGGVRESGVVAAVAEEVETNS